jgi:hypothetical protein
MVYRPPATGGRQMESDSRPTGHGCAAESRAAATAVVSRGDLHAWMNVYAYGNPLA